MPVDTAAHISEFNTALPTSADPQSEGDDNFRHVKGVLKTDFPNIDAPMTLTAGAINALPADIQAVDDRLTSEAARLDQADIDQSATLNTTISTGDDAVRGEFAAADTTTYNNAVADAGIAADAKVKTGDDNLRGEVTVGKTVLGAYGEAATVQSNLDSHIATQAGVDSDQDAAIASIQSQLADLGAGDTDLDLAKQYADQQDNELRGSPTHDPDKTVFKNYDAIQANAANIATNATNISNNDSDIATLQTTVNTTHANQLSNHESRITTLEGQGGELTMQLIVDTLYPVGSYLILGYNQSFPSVLNSYGSWTGSNTRAVMYMNASRNDIVDNGYKFVGPQLNSTSGHPSQSVMDSVPVRAYLRTA